MSGFGLAVAVPIKAARTNTEAMMKFILVSELGINLGQCWNIEWNILTGVMSLTSLGLIYKIATVHEHYRKNRSSAKVMQICKVIVIIKMVKTATLC